MANIIRLPLVLNRKPQNQIPPNDLPSLSIHPVGAKSNNNNKQRTIYQPMSNLLSSVPLTTERPLK